MSKANASKRVSNVNSQNASFVTSSDHAPVAIMKPNIFTIFTYPLTIFALVLAVLGLVNLYSATQSLELTQTSSLFWAQLSYTGIGIVSMLVMASVSIRQIQTLAYVFFWSSVFLLILVLVIGAKSHGAQSWLDLGVVRLQPSEFGKVGLIFALAKHFSTLNDDQSLGLRELVFPLLIYSVPTGLVVLQNDLGSSLFYGLIFASLLLLQGVRFKLAIIVLILVVGVGFVSYKYYLKPYQKNRIISFMEPEKDHRGSGYHLVQSKIAVGSGGIFGKGYLKGESHKLNFLPERHTDFIFPVLLEEWGFIGGIVVLMCYFIFLVAGVSVATQSESRFSFFLSIGVVAMYFWHLVINLGGVLGLLPLTGVTLPFFSYGGSSLVANWVAIGVLLAVMRGK